jgi:hypothetical protein
MDVKLRRLIWALLAFEVLATGLDLWFGPWSRMHWEERFNARAGVQLTCGHWDRIWEMQYRSFCGGCTAEAALAAPIFSLLGPTVLAWKIVPVAFHLGVTFLGTLAARLAGGPRAALLWLALMIAAPGFYRDLALTGWGNHVESTVFPLGAVLLLALAARSSAWVRSPLLLMAGAWAGLGLWFCHTSAHALPALGLAAVLATRWQSPAFLAGLPLGALPWWIYQPLSSDQNHGTDWLQSLHPAPWDRWVEWFAGPMLRDGLWSPFDYGDLGPLPELWWTALWGLAGIGGIWALRAVWRREVPDRGAALLGPVAVVSLVVAYGLRFDLWQQLPDSATDPSLNLRYLSPLIPMLWLAAALAPQALVARPRIRRVALGALGLMVLGGLGARISQWERGHGPELAEGVYAHSGWPDRTVPPGQPPQQLARMWHRPSDIQAARDFIASHTDPLAECAWDHWQELGRRLGLAMARTAQGVPDQARWLSAVPDDLPRGLIADALIKPWVNKDGKGLDQVPSRAAALEALAPGWGSELQAAADRRTGGR